MTLLGRAPFLSKSSAVSSSSRMSSISPEINLIPFIDVLLVILIFLMISTTFTHYQELSIHLPIADGQATDLAQKEIQIAISRDGKYAVNGIVVGLPALQDRLTQFKNQRAGQDEAGLTNLRVVISADAKATHDSVIQVLEFASQLGLSHLVFATQSPAPRKR